MILLNYYLDHKGPKNIKLNGAACLPPPHFKGLVTSERTPMESIHVLFLSRLTHNLKTLKMVILASEVFFLMKSLMRYLFANIMVCNKGRIAQFK